MTAKVLRKDESDFVQPRFADAVCRGTEAEVPLTPHDAAHTPKPKGEIRITANGFFCFCLLYGLFKFRFIIYLKETFGHCYYFSRTKNVEICSLRIKFNFLCSTSWIS